jgi:16S rRNA (guanine(527)-N(7))-methyltransferase RsmG
MIEIKSKEIIAQYLDQGKIDQFLDEVENANRKMNLFSRGSSRDDLMILVAESVLPVHLGMISPESGPILDIGSGWGIPSIPLLLWNKDLDITLIERSKKKADFLILALHRLGLRADIINSDIEHIPEGDKFEIITLRQVAMEKRFVKAVRRHCAADAKFIYFGPVVDEKPYTSVTTAQYIIDRKPVRTVTAANFSQK